VKNHYLLEEVLEQGPSLVPETRRSDVFREAILVPPNSYLATPGVVRMAFLPLSFPPVSSPPPSPPPLGRHFCGDEGTRSLLTTRATGDLSPNSQERFRFAPQRKSFSVFRLFDTF